VAEITDKAARVGNTLVLVRTREMRKLFSQLYAQVFEYYRDAIEWYMKSKKSRFWDSFNEKLKDQYDRAAAKIDVTVMEMYRQTNLAHHAQFLTYLKDHERREEVCRQRQQSPKPSDLVAAGRFALQLLLSTYKSACIESSNTNRPRPNQGHDPNTPFTQDALTPGKIDRADARRRTTRLDQFIIGTEGHSFLNEGKFWLPHVDVSSRLHDWFGTDEASPTLWICSPDRTRTDLSSSRAAALSLLIVAWQAKLPIISHFCERPRFADLESDRDVERVGLLGLVYSLITQLLQFAFDGDKFETSKEHLEDLNGRDESWPQALSLLATLLKATPHLGLCVIDGLNDLSFSGGGEWCSAFLAMLFEHQKSAPGIFRILLTTSGQSRVLPDYVDAADRVFAQTGGREIIRGGQWVSAPES